MVQPDARTCATSGDRPNRRPRWKLEKWTAHRSGATLGFVSALSEKTR